MVMTPDAVYRHSQHRLADDINLIVKAVSLLLSDIGGRVLSFTKPEESCCCDALIPACDFVKAWIGERISRKMLRQKTVVRDIFVERTDDIVAVLPRVRHVKVKFVTQRLAVPHEIQPVTAPALTVSRACEQAINHTGVRIRAGIRNECGDFIRSWRQPGEIKCHAAQQRPLICLGAWL